MTNNEPEFERPAIIPVQLCFFYDPVTHNIPFYSSPPDSFFGAASDQTQDPPFLKALDQTDAGFFLSEWQSCSRLSENESKNFTIPGADPENPVSFSFLVTKPGSALLSDPVILVVTVAKTLSNFHSRKKDESSPSSNDLYSEFIELAVHDLDSPLRKLSMLMDRITSKYEDMTDKDTQAYVLRSRACLSDMRSLIENLSVLASLNISKLNKVPCDLERIVQTALKDMAPGENNESMTMGSMPTVEGDINQYRQLFRSLLENAFKFRKKGAAAGVEIFSALATDVVKKLHNLPVNKTYYQITIADNGIGFREEYAVKIFQPFVRLNGKSEYPGSGIGLAISKKIVENHGGIMYAEGDENVGSRFILLLPLSPD